MPQGNPLGYLDPNTLGFLGDSASAESQVAPFQNWLLQAIQGAQAPAPLAPQQVPGTQPNLMLGLAAALGGPQQAAMLTEQIQQNAARQSQENRFAAMETQRRQEAHTERMDALRGRLAAVQAQKEQIRSELFGRREEQLTRLGEAKARREFEAGEAEKDRMARIKEIGERAAQELQLRKDITKADDESLRAKLKELNAWMKETAGPQWGPMFASTQETVENALKLRADGDYEKANSLIAQARTSAQLWGLGIRQLKPNVADEEMETMFSEKVEGLAESLNQLLDVYTLSQPAAKPVDARSGGDSALKRFGKNFGEAFGWIGPVGVARGLKMSLDSIGPDLATGAAAMNEAMIYGPQLPGSFDVPPPPTKMQMAADQMDTTLTSRRRLGR